VRKKLRDGTAVKEETESRKTPVKLRKTKAGPTSEKMQECVKGVLRHGYKEKKVEQEGESREGSTSSAPSWFERGRRNQHAGKEVH